MVQLQRIVFVEDHQAVKPVIFGDVAGGDGVSSANPAKRVLWGALKRFVQTDRCRFLDGVDEYRCGRGVPLASGPEGR